MKFLSRRRIASVLLTGTLAALAVPGVAFAGTWSTSKSSPCSSVISGSTAGGLGYARLKYTAHRSTTRKYIIEAAKSTANDFQTCAQGNAVLPYRITVTQQFQFHGSALTCTGGINASFPRSAGISFACTGSGSTVTETLSTTCAVRESQCLIDQGYMEIIAPSGASFSDYVLAKTGVVVKNSSGNALSWSTPFI